MREEREENVFFSDRNLVKVYHPHDVVVIFMIVAKHNIQRVLVDNGSLTDILFYDNFVRINLSNN